MDRTQRNTTSSGSETNTLPAYDIMMADGCSDLLRTSLSKLIGSVSARHEHSLVDTLVDYETVANSIVVDLTRSQLSDGRS
jgi:hypothetical protein